MSAKKLVYPMVIGFVLCTVTGTLAAKKTGTGKKSLDMYEFFRPAQPLTLQQGMRTSTGQVLNAGVYNLEVRFLADDTLWILFLAPRTLQPLASTAGQLRGVTLPAAPTPPPTRATLQAGPVPQTGPQGSGGLTVGEPCGACAAVGFGPGSPVRFQANTVIIGGAGTAQVIGSLSNP